ncbi:ABC transporter ATP-binding protein [Streptomyces sp. TRM64462]|uniref:ABC transporter ATP-binding protein n=1 Tax=Streptomyces sp. TRM64462 TaxID=2741726 RepID=UPI0015865295|nr:ABC transporter ATP-binding protein [Streptomyces sp. TRM64462]
MTAPALLQLTGVARRYGERTVLAPLDLAVRAGECVAVMGANGSGKSTLLRIAVGHDRPSEGTVTFAGRPVDDTDARVRARIAVVAGSPAFYPDLTVGEHLELVAVAHGAGRDSRARVAEALDRTRLTGLADRLPGSLSSGQAQQLLLASALVRPRDLLVLDEPEQRLDPDARDELAARLREERAAGPAPAAPAAPTAPAVSAAPGQSSPAASSR